MIRSPLRQDQHPTCVFTYYKGRLRFRDWSDKRSKDVLDLVETVTGLRFQEALNDIAARFQLKAETDPVPEIVFEREKREEREKRGKKNIRVKRRAWRKEDVRYLRQFGLDKKIVEAFRCFPIDTVWLEGKPVYYDTTADPAIGYYFGSAGAGEERWKIYFYKRGRQPGRPRFMGNTSRINGWVQIPKEGRFVVITKSMKDVMTLASFGIPAIAMQGESTKPYPRIIEELKGRFEKIFTLYDFDLTGVRMANTLRKEFGLIPLFLTGRSKDISDYVRDNGRFQTSQMIERVYNHFGL